MEFLNLLYKSGAASHITTGYVMSDHTQPSVFDNCSDWPFEKWGMCVNDKQRKLFSASQRADAHLSHNSI